MRDKILNLLKEKGDLLPPLPRILFNLEKLINDPNSDIESIATLVETEPVFSGKLIKMANSPYFGGSLEKSRDFPAVILRLGIKMILELAYTLELPQMFDKLKRFDQIRFWKHSMAVALLARSLARHSNLDENTQAETFRAGLMHDMGILVFFYLIPEEYKKFGEGLKGSDQPSQILEQEKFGISHSELGARFLKLHWPVSEAIVKAAENHHQPIAKENIKDDETWMVSVADTLVIIHGIDHEFNTAQEFPTDNYFMDALNWSLEELEALVKETKESVKEAEKILMG